MEKIKREGQNAGSSFRLPPSISQSRGGYTLKGPPLGVSSSASAPRRFGLNTALREGDELKSLEEILGIELVEEKKLVEVIEEMGSVELFGLQTGASSSILARMPAVDMSRLWYTVYREGEVVGYFAQRRDAESFVAYSSMSQKLRWKVGELVRGLKRRLLDDVSRELKEIEKEGEK